MVSRLLTASCTFVFVSVIYSAKLPKDCEVDDKTYKSGETFTRANFGGPCNIYLCKNGGYQVNKFGCFNEDDQKCYDVDQEVMENCFTKRCYRRGSRIRFETIKSQCQGTDKKCHDVGQTFTDTADGIEWSCLCSLEGETKVNSHCTRTSE
ncbi:hypothetical protein SNE40_019525 [Patella caerulea]|uniref:Uncharacterized protein n=1 Tax=Patella caerulea TaxID=87958 RepID=A0AAN8J9L2_PATCE